MTRQRKKLATAASCCLLLGVTDLAVLNVWLAPAVWPEQSTPPHVLESISASYNRSKSGRQTASLEHPDPTESALTSQRGEKQPDAEPTTLRSTAERTTIQEAPLATQERVQPPRSPSAKVATASPHPSRGDTPSEPVRSISDLRQPVAPQSPKDDSRILEEIVVYFESGVCFLSTEQKIEMLRKVRRFEEKEKLWIQLEGHADRTGSPESNIRIAEMRAQRIGTLLKKIGFSPDQITFMAYGSSQPVDTRDNAEAWAKNRRVVIRIYEGGP